MKTEVYNRLRMAGMSGRLVNTVTGKFIDFPVCVIRSIFIRKLLHLTISSPFILINQKNA